MGMTGMNIGYQNAASTTTWFRRYCILLKESAVKFLEFLCFPLHGAILSLLSDVPIFISLFIFPSAWIIQ
jgi:hypothetical protein